MIGRPIARRGRPGLLGTAARTAVVAGTATAVSRRASQRHSAAVAGEAPPATPPAAPPAPQADDLISQLRELGQLRDQGVLTEEEFAIQKSRLLNR